MLKMIKYISNKAKLEVLLNLRIWVDKERDKINFLMKSSKSDQHDWYHGQIIGLNYVEERIIILIDELERGRNNA